MSKANPFDDIDIPETRMVSGRDYREYRFPDGFRLFGDTSPLDIANRYDDLILHRRFFPQGIHPGPGDVIIDVGAGLGLYTIFASREWPGTTIHAFDPLSTNEKLWKANILLHQVDNVVFHRFGLGEGRYEEADIAFYPGWTGISTRYPEMKGDFQKSLEGRLLPDDREDLFDFRIFPVPLRTLSFVLDDIGVTSIALLKIDVEGDERPVLLGIEERHWPAVRGLVMRIHDMKGEGEAILKILEDRAPHLELDRAEPDYWGRVVVVGRSVADDM